MRIRLGIADIFVVAAVLTLLLLQMGGFANDPGVGWHLRTGELIASSGQVPRMDPFLATPDTHRWVSDQWLSDYALWGLFQSGGYPLVYACIAVLYLVTFWGILFWGILPLGVSPLAALVATFFSFKLGLVHFILRPVVFSFPIFAALLVILFRVYEGIRKGEGISSWVFIAVPLLLLLWANVHPSFVLGLVLIATVLFGVAWNAVVLGEELPDGTTLKILALLCICGAITLLNPNGIELHKSIISLAQSDYFMSHHIEWRPPDFHSTEGVLFEATIFFLLIGALCAPRPYSGIGFFHLLATAFFLHGAFQSVRGLPYLGIVVALPLAVSFDAGWKWLHRRLFIGRDLPRYVLSLVQLRSAEKPGAISLLCISAALMYMAVVQQRVPFAPSELGPSRAKYPYGAMETLRTQQSGEVRLLSTPDWGGFITLHGYPRIRPVIDDRNTLLGEASYRNFYAAMEIGGDWRSFATRHQATHLLLPASSGIAQWLKSVDGLTVIAEDGVGILFRVESATTRLSSASE